MTRVHEMMTINNIEQRLTFATRIRDQISPSDYYALHVLANYWNPVDLGWLLYRASKHKKPLEIILRAWAAEDWH